MSNLKEIMENRRTIYGLSDEVSVTEQTIIELVTHALKHAPTAFNSQSPRVAILFGAQHHLLWQNALEVLRKVVPAEGFAATQAKIDSFAAAYGTILFFEEQDVTKNLQEAYPLYRDNFLPWAEQASAILQYAIWLLLEAEGLGASLQHYNPLINEEVAKQLGCPANYRLMAQMPFGAKTAPAGAKEFLPIEQRLQIFK